MKPDRPLPTLRELTAELRGLHEAWAHPEAGGEFVVLAFMPIDEWAWDWRATVPHRAEDWEATHAGREYIPGDGEPFDATAAARRLLAAARDAGFR